MSQPLEKIIILDFTNGEVHVFPFDSNTHDADGLVEELHEGGEISSPSNCQWMTVEELSIKIH